jgi:hypothetical protein
MEALRIKKEVVKPFLFRPSTHAARPSIRLARHGTARTHAHRRWPACLPASPRTRPRQLPSPARPAPAETNRISAGGNLTLCTFVVVPGGLPRATPVSAIPKIHTEVKIDRVQQLFITLIRVHLFGTCRVQVHQD